MPPKHKGESPSLVRVRNNQRRSRARRREYIADLERRIHDCEANGLPNRNVVPQDMIRQLEDENRKLRELLHITGVEQTLVDTHLKDDDGDPEVAGSDSLMQSSPETALENLSADLIPAAHGASMAEASGDLLAASFLQLPGDEFDMLFSLPDPAQPMLSLDHSSISHIFAGNSLPFPYNSSSFPASSLPLSDVHPLCPAESSLPTASQSDRATTLCSAAYKLIREHNKKGVDMIEISIRLWNGFVKGDGVGGCQVESKLLFSVLEYISG